MDWQESRRVYVPDLVVVLTFLGTPDVKSFAQHQVGV